MPNKEKQMINTIKAVVVNLQVIHTVSKYLQLEPLVYMFHLE